MHHTALRSAACHDMGPSVAASVLKWRLQGADAAHQLCSPILSSGVYVSSSSRALSRRAPTHSDMQQCIQPGWYAPGAMLANIWDLFLNTQ